MASKSVLFGVVITDKQDDKNEIVVVANNSRSARVIAIQALEISGLGNRRNIKNTLVWEKLGEVWK
jgi:hypothetical protein